MQVKPALYRRYSAKTPTVFAVVVEKNEHLKRIEKSLPKRGKSGSKALFGKRLL